MTQDRTVVLAVVGLVGLSALVFGGGALILLALGKTVPGEVWTLAGTAVGGLVALLTSTRTTPPNQPSEGAAPPTR